MQQPARCKWPAAALTLLEMLHFQVSFSCFEFWVMSMEWDFQVILNSWVFFIRSIYLMQAEPEVARAEPTCIGRWFAKGISCW